MKDRTQQLHEIARNYVASLGTGDFDNIPYTETVELRALSVPVEAEYRSLVAITSRKRGGPRCLILFRASRSLTPI